MKSLELLLLKTDGLEESVLRSGGEKMVSVCGFERVMWTGRVGMATNDLCFLLLFHFLVYFSDAWLTDVMPVCNAG